jgi:hypothetical protein
MGVCGIMCYFSLFFSCDMFVCVRITHYAHLAHICDFNKKNVQIKKVI